MSEQTSRLGLGNSLREETEVLHTSVMGKRSFGRVTDLLMVWAEKQGGIPRLESSTLRILTQALLEFAYPEGKQDMGNLEFAVEEGKYFISARYQASAKGEIAKIDAEKIEKDMTYYWMNSPKVGTLKKNLGTHDRVEVRFHTKLNLVEWRVIHEFKDLELELNQSSFVVLVDPTDKIETAHGKYTDMGDVPYDKLLAEVYKSSNTKQKSGELFFQGQSVQNEDEIARVTFEKEQQEIEDEIRISGGSTKEEDESVRTFSMSEDEEQEINKKSAQYSDELFSRLRIEQGEIKEQAKQAINDAKKSELQAQRQAGMLGQKVKKLEDLVKRKELASVRAQSQAKVLNDKIKELQAKTSTDGNVKAFRDKALQMHSMLKKVKEDYTLLEKTVAELRKREKDIETKNEADQMLSKVNTSSNQLDELTKKAERTQRALDAEKIKVKQLSERVIIAERESASTGPQVQDLERKVEQALKLTQQSKKETENIKQKLVQADAEKNKVQNELMKAQAQIQTLMKRQAS